LAPNPVTDEYRVKPNLVARAFPVKHSRGAVGYCLLETRKKLKKEYHGLSGKQIVELKKQGVDIQDVIEIPLVSYLGDTQYVDYSQIDYISKSKILIAECTFFEDEHTDRAFAGKHMHIDEFAPLIERMENEHVIITHLTHRTSITEAKKTLKERLSEETYKKVMLLMDRNNWARRKKPPTANSPA
jgi:ribonuclease Z